MALKKNLDIIIFEKLYENMIQGEWEAGQGISPDNIAAAYEVSRTPVVQALKRMREIGMLGVSATGHFYVPAFSKKQVIDLMEVRALIERQALANIRDKKRTVDFGGLQKLAEDCARCNAADETVNARKADLRFHTLLVSTGDNTYLDQAYSKIQAQFIVANYLLTSHTQEQQRIAAEDHLHLLDAMRAGDYEMAIQIATEHITGARDKILARMK